MSETNSKFDPTTFIKGLGNYGYKELTDLVVDLRNEQKVAKLKEGLVQQALKARTNPPLTSEDNYPAWDNKVIEGNTNNLRVIVVKQERLDTDRLKAEQPDLVRQYTKTISFIQMKSEPKGE